MYIYHRPLPYLDNMKAELSLFRFQKAMKLYTKHYIIGKYFMDLNE